MRRCAPPPGGRGRAALALLVLMAGCGSAEAWGFTAHRMVNRKAVAALPPPLRALFEANLDYVAEHSIDPDLWRAAGRPGEEIDHFLDLDAFGAGGLARIPLAESEHLARNGPDAEAKGRLPWRVGEVYGELVRAFREGDLARALERAAVLGHYVGDAHVPLHAATNYDGQLSGQKGVHNRWESVLVERYARQLEPEVRAEPPRRVGDPVAFTLDALRASLDNVEGLLASDRACAGATDFVETPQDDRYDDAYYSKLYEREHERLRARLAAAASAVGSLWLSAWEEAGRPEPPDWSFPYVRGRQRAILLSLDGASAPLIDDAVGRGLMPHLAALRSAGASARGVRPPFPCKTSSGHAALFTGAWPPVNGIAGNEVPVPGGTIADADSGFSSKRLRAEPLWVTAARQGLRASVPVATQAFPFGPFLEERRFGGNYGHGLVLLDAYRSREANEAVLRGRDLSLRPARDWPGEPPGSGAREFTLTLAGASLQALVFDDPADPVAGLDTLLIARRKDDRQSIRLKPVAPRGLDPSAFGALTFESGGGTAGAGFRLFALSPDGSDLLLYHSRVHVLHAAPPRVAPAALEAVGAVVGNGASDLYYRGALGPPLWKGGDGTSERRYLETVGLALRQLGRLTDFALDRTRWDLLVTYLPYPDEALHAWLGFLDPRLDGYDAALAARVRPLLDLVLEALDAQVGHLMERAGSDTILAVVSDHGMVGASAVVRPNVALARAGLLAVDARGQVDRSRTRAYCFPEESGFVLVNRVSRKDGIVPPSEEEGVRRAAADALRGIVDPATGRGVVVELLDPREESNRERIGGPAGGDLYFRLAPGYAPAAAATGPVVEHLTPFGAHFQDPERPEMEAIFTLAGPGVARGADLGTIPIIDVAPTLSALLGIEPPAEATGRVLDEALVRRAGAAAGRR